MWFLGLLALLGGLFDGQGPLRVPVAIRSQSGFMDRKAHYTAGPSSRATPFPPCPGGGDRREDTSAVRRRGLEQCLYQVAVVVSSAWG
jgi:hypothetical protein